jgi:hypothetical protein
MMQQLMPQLRKGSLLYRVAARSLAILLPASYTSHMLLAVARRP